jgi:ribosomal protein S18 acetylase RimI-like enzyme
MRSSVAVRPAVAADIEPLLTLFDEVAAELIYIGTEPGYDRDLYQARFESMIVKPDKTPLFVAHSGDLLIGQLSIYRHEEYGPTIAMMISSAFRGRGIGRALLEAAFEWARDHGVTTLSLLVFPHNARAVALYRSAGFEEIERYERDVVRQNGEVWDTMLMRKTLA